MCIDQFMLSMRLDGVSAIPVEGKFRSFVLNT